MTDAVAEPPDPADAFSVNGVVELLPLNNRFLLAMERSFSVGAPDTGNTIRIYAVSLPGRGEGDAYLPWPAGGIEPPVRRRRPDEAGKDRTHADPDARWEAAISLTPPPPPAGTMEERRQPGWDAVVEAVAAELGAAWSAENIDGWFAEMRAAARRARRSPTGEAGWATSFTRAYVVTLDVLAPTAERAREAAEARVPELPPGWTAQASVEFAGD